MEQFEEQETQIKEEGAQDSPYPTLVHAPELGERYKVLSLIGNGAMASVYKIYDQTLGKVFAAKVMKDELLSEPNSLKRFADEVTAASAMTHGNIAAVYSHGLTDKNVPFLCMD